MALAGRPVSARLARIVVRAARGPASAAREGAAIADVFRRHGRSAQDVKVTKNKNGCCRIRRESAVGHNQTD
jgi:hypothetical protein